MIDKLKFFIYLTTLSELQNPNDPSISFADISDEHIRYIWFA